MPNANQTWRLEKNEWRVCKTCRVFRAKNSLKRICVFYYGLAEQQRHMNKVIENSEEERVRLIELIKSLELKLSSIEQRAVEEQWSMRQRQATLDAERAAFQRERTFMREKMEAEQKRVEVMFSISFKFSILFL